jgi:hypothetical protein
VPYSTIADYDAVILSGLNSISDGLAQSLSKAVKEKISLLIFPDKKSSIASYNTLLASCNAPQLGNLDTAKVRAGTINYKHPIFANVFKHEIANADLPSFFAHFKIIKPSHSATNDILTAESSDELIVSTASSAGTIYLFASPCNDKATSLVKHPLFVPLILNMVMNASSLAPLQYKIGSSTLVTVPVSSSDNALIHIVNKQKTTDFIPQQLNVQNGSKTRLMLGGYISDAGFYTVTSAKKEIAELAFNFNRLESKMEFFNPTEIRYLASRYVILSNVIDKPKDLTGESIKQMDKGIMLWKWLILASLLFVLMEVLLVRFFRF